MTKSIVEEMIAPFVQGFLLIGVVYWYSKGMLSLINDHYREEFKTYLENDPKKDTYLKTKQSDENTRVKDIDLSPKVEGLPDVLNVESNLVCRSGIVSRGVDSSTVENAIISSLNKDDKDSEDELQQIENYRDDKSCSNSRQLLDSNEFNYDSALLQCDRQPNDQPILNPSVGNKLNYEQIVNQQVSIIINDGDKSTSKTSSDSSSHGERGANNGNCSGNVGCYKKKSLSVQTSPVDVGVAKQKSQVEACPNPSNSEPIWHTTCKRKSVTEMIQFWSNFEQNAQGNY